MIPSISDKSGAYYASSRLSMFVAIFISGAFIHSPAIAAFIPPPTGGGQLNNQLRQQDRNVLLAPVAPSVSFPTDERGSIRLPAGDARITLTRVMFTGDVPVPGLKGSSAAALQAVVAPWTGRSLTFSDLQAMTEAVTRHYRDQGALLARAILPPQTVKDGVLTVQVVAGKYDSASVSNTSHLKTSQAMRMVSAAAPAGSVVTRSGLERMALLLAEVPGISSQVALKSGSLPGTSSAEVALTPGQSVGGYVGLDNMGDQTTGRSRVMAGLYANELMGYGDRLRVDLLDAYEKSDLFNGSLDYSLLAGGYGTRFGASYSHLNYHYTFLQQGFSGYSDNWGVYGLHPLVRSGTARVDLRADVGQQFLTDKYPSALYDAEHEGRKRVSLVSLSVTGSVASVPGGVTGFGLKGTTGSTDYRTPLSRSLSFSRELGTSGQFSRLNWDLNHQQALWGPFSAYAGLTGQLANHNLDSSQKFLLGGLGAVRAYESGTGSVDYGTVGSLEVRWEHGFPWLVRAGGNPSVTVAGFYDQGWGEQYADNHNRVSGGKITPDNRVNLSGAGLYTAVADAGNYALTLTWAHRTGAAAPSGPSDRDLFRVSAVKTF
ncbi:TPA: ShlB/FhaC/HecB family hemolysin secretion/activation protein [Salmonella enterica subsp. enterica serovar Potsdam]|nr:ShlB/FhaC/HecB family hemolysin secretion/activation protein [Salmonella enterica subsp. enterica serovar Potsdam]